jgi:hypothetical protein
MVYAEIGLMIISMYFVSAPHFATRPAQCDISGEPIPPKARWGLVMWLCSRSDVFGVWLRICG